MRLKWIKTLIFNQVFENIQNIKFYLNNFTGLKMAPKKEVKLEKSGLFKKPAEPTKKSGGKSESSGEKRKMSALEEIMKEEEERKKKQASFLLKK